MTDKYAQSGVHIVATNTSLESLQTAISSTHSPSVLSDIGGFGSLFDLSDIIQNYTHPILVQTIDGVGTKLTVAKHARSFRNIGHDIIAACAGDILAMGATPINCMDYIAHESFDEDMMATFMSGLVDACKHSNIALVGGETAEMPGVYVKGEHDIVCSMMGVVEKSKIIDGSSIQEGDVAIALASSGLHTNGYSLARMIAFDQARLTVDSYSPYLNATIGDALLVPHRNYTAPLTSLCSSEIPVHGISHITGGGLIDNIKRILPEHIYLNISKNKLRVPSIMTFLAQIGDLSFEDMIKAWNMGVGVVVIVPAHMENQTIANLKASVTYPVWKIGTVMRGTRSVNIV